MKINRYAAKCKLCKTRWMTTEDRQQAFTNHESVCPKYTALFTTRLASMNRFVNITHKEDAERYQMSQLFFEYDQVNGHINNAVKCDARCEGATRHNCECACGGQNHGIGKVA